MTGSVRRIATSCSTRCREEARRLHSYVQNLLDMTRIGSPDFQLKREWVDLADLVESARKRLDSSWRQHRLLIHFDQQIPQLYVHGALIEQVLVNILDNALPLLASRHPIEFKVMLADPDLIIDIIDIGLASPSRIGTRSSICSTPSRWGLRQSRHRTWTRHFHAP